jgi:arginase
MADAAWLPLPYPEALVVARDSLEEQSDAIARGLPARPLVLGGCCCAHLGAIRGLATRADTLAVVWLDSHGDSNTPETSVSGNPWGMPLRTAIDEGSVAPAHVALVGARNLDPPEAEFLAANGIDDDMARAVAGADGVYVALDADVLAPGEIASHMTEPGGPTVAELETTLAGLAAADVPVVGAGLTGLTPEADLAVLERLLRALRMGRPRHI